jgi:hypothetical protein
MILFCVRDATGLALFAGKFMLFEKLFRKKAERSDPTAARTRQDYLMEERIYTGNAIIINILYVKKSTFIKIFFANKFSKHTLLVNKYFSNRVKPNKLCRTFVSIKA